MNKLFNILSVVSFLAIIFMVILIAFGAVNPINWLKYLILAISIFLTLFSVGIFIRKSDFSKGITVFIFILLILPCFAPLLGFIKTEYITDYWKLFVGGSIFQIGTGIFFLFGGYKRKDNVDIYQALNISNYIIFIFLTLILIFNIDGLMSRNLLLSIGGILSLLSLILGFYKKKGVT